MSSVKFSFTHTCTDEIGYEDLIIEVSATHYEAERAPRDEYGRPQGADFDEYIGDYDILRAYYLCDGLKISQITPDIEDVEGELDDAVWGHYRAAKDQYYEYEVQF